MSHEDVKLEAWQAAVSPKLDCCTEPTLRHRHCSDVIISMAHSLWSMGTLVDGVTRAGVMTFGRRDSVFAT